MAKFKLTLDCDNAAFSDDSAGEIANILHRLSVRLPRVIDDMSGILLDMNGNRVGSWVGSWAYKP